VRSYGKILVALDGSSSDRVALGHAAHLAREHRARLVALTVVPPLPWLAAAASIGGGLASINLETAHDRALRHAVGALPHDVSVESILVRGQPAKCIAEVADRHACDVIVLGAGNSYSLGNPFRKSMSAAVARHSEKPVLVVRASPAAPSEGIADRLAVVLT
jgi:nucleotide-binding universal stress UspA family protein